MVAVFGIHGYYGVRRAFRTGSSDGYYAANRQSFRNRALLAAVEIPEVAVIYNTQGNAFGRVHNGAAAYSQDEVYAFFFGQFNAFVNQVGVGAGLYAAQFNMSDPLSVQRLFYPIQQAGTHCAAAAVMDQNLMAIVLLYIFAGFIFGALAEYKIRGAVKSKVIHL